MNCKLISETKYGVKTKIIVADFCQGQKAVEIVKREVGTQAINILGMYIFKILMQNFAQIIHLQ